MEECEVCGKPSQTLFIVNIEGARMQACSSCANGKDAVRVVSAKPAKAQAGAGPMMKGGDDSELVDDYAARIKHARESAGLKIEELGIKINERRSNLARIEEGRAVPDNKLIKKLEKEFGIRLIHKVEASAPPRQGGGPVEVTLGDAVIRKEPKK